MVDNDYAGSSITMESFTAQTTDGSGDITVTLQNAPTADDAIMVNLQGVAGAFAQFKTRTTTSVTFTVFQKYDKIDTTITGSLSNLPAGVTEATSKGATDSGGGGSINAVDGVTHSTGNHTHGLSTTYQHNHTATVTATALSTLNTTADITLVVTYAF